MKIKIIYKKKIFKFLVKLDKNLIINFFIKKLIIKFLSNNISLIIYNYILLIKLLRIYGLIKPLINLNDFK